jgi:hypothetical protein
VPQTVRRTLLALAGAALAALPTLAQSLPPVHAPPPAQAQKVLSPNGYDLLKLISDYADSQAKEAREKYELIAAFGWDRVRRAYHVDEKEDAEMRTKTQADVVLFLEKTYRSELPSIPESPGRVMLQAHIQFLSDLAKDNSAAKPEAGWVVEKARLEALHRAICKELVRQIPPPSKPNDAPPAVPTPPGNGSPNPPEVPVEKPKNPPAARVDKWEQRSCVEGGFAIDTPAGVKVNTHHWAVSGKPRPALGAWFECSPADGLRFEVGYQVLSADTPELGEAKTREFLVKHARDLHSAGHAVCELPKWYGPNYGLDAIYESPTFASRVRSFVIGRRLYFVRVVGPDRTAVSTPDAWRFFHSLALDAASRNLAEVTEPGRLQSFFELYPWAAEVERNASQSTKDVMDFAFGLSDQANRECFLQFDPTHYAYSKKEREGMFMAHLDKVQAEIDDPKTPADRRVQLQQYLQSRLSLMSYAANVADGIHRKVIKAQNDLAARNTYWQTRRDAEGETIRSEMTLQAAREALWRR